MSTITAKDLTKEFPRSPYEELKGIVWLPRLIDKVRALNAGKIGEYVPFPCGGDRNFLGQMGIEPEAIKPIIDGGASDDEIAQWVLDHAKDGWQDNMAGYRNSQYEGYTDPAYLGYLKEGKDELAKARPDLDLSNVVNFAQLICAEEGHPVPAKA